MIADNLKSMTEIAKANGIQVVLSSVLPAYDFPWRPGIGPAPKVVSLNAWIKCYAAQAGVVYLDYYTKMVDARGGLSPAMASDGVHPTARALGLEPHPEGGWFRQTWRAPTEVALPDGRTRPTATLIWFLLPAGDRSAWHRVTSDEVWLAHEGTVRLQLGGTDDIPRDGAVHVVGADTAAGQEPEVVVPAGHWQRTLAGDRDALVRCLVSPGFDFEDFQLG